MQKNFIILKGDYLTDMNFNSLIDFHVRNQSDLSLVCEKYVAPTASKKKKDGTDDERDPFEPSTVDPFDFPVYILEEQTNRLVGLVEPDDLDVKQPCIKIKQSILLRHPRVYFSQKLMSRYIAVCSLEVCKILDSLKKSDPKRQFFTEFGTDFLRFLAAHQYNKKLLEMMNSNVDIDLQPHKDSFRPFVYTTDEFGIRIKSYYEFHQANVLRISRLSKDESERGIFSITTNDVFSMNQLIMTGPNGERLEPIEPPKQVEIKKPAATVEPAAPIVQTPADGQKSKQAAPKPDAGAQPEGDGASKYDARAQKKAEQAAKKEAARAKEAGAAAGKAADSTTKEKPEASQLKTTSTPEQSVITNSQAETAETGGPSVEDVRAQKKAEQAAKKEAARAKEAAQKGEPTAKTDAVVSAAAAVKDPSQPKEAPKQTQKPSKDPSEQKPKDKPQTPPAAVQPQPPVAAQPPAEAKTAPVTTTTATTAGDKAAGKPKR